MILGGFLMLPTTFEKDPRLRVTKEAMGIFAGVLLAAGLSGTGLVSFAVPNPWFQRDVIFWPSLTSCAIGLLTVLYDFIIFTRYSFNTSALITTLAGAISTAFYAIMLIWSHRKISQLQKGSNMNTLSQQALHQQHQHHGSESTLWQERGYYENYNRNMYPTAHHARSPSQPQQQFLQELPMRGNGPGPSDITEEEMQRQQMLMLLLQKDEPPPPGPLPSTFHIDWQGRDEDDGSGNQVNEFYGSQSTYAQTAYPGPSPGIVRKWTNELRPWDGVWRTPARVSTSPWHRPTSRMLREARRMEIEQGTRQ